MTKIKHINFKISESDFKKLEAMRGDKTITQLMRDLIKSALENEQQEANSFIELLKKIEATDTAKTAERVERLEQRVEKIAEAMRAMHGNMKIVFSEVKHVKILVEELANVLIIRSDYREKYFERVKQRTEEKQQ